jgi:hypothetical protein
MTRPKSDRAFISELRRKYVLRPDDLVFQDGRNTVLFIRNGGKKLFRATREDGRVKPGRDNSVRLFKSG